MTNKTAVAAVLLLGTVSLAHAQGTMERGGGGASQLSPGHEMRGGADRDDRGPGASGYSPGHEMNEHGTVGESRGDRDDRTDMDRTSRHDMDRDSDDHRTIGESRGDRDVDRDRGDRDRGASELSPGDRMHDRDIDRR